MEKIGALGLYGHSGNKYQFEIHPFRTELSEIPAVYAVTKRYTTDDGEYRHNVIYIGRTYNLKKAFAKHRRKTCFTENEANCLCILRDGDTDSRKKKVKDLIDRINPRCNS